MIPDTFAALTLDDQLAHLEGALESAPVAELLTLCRAVRDHAPMAWLSSRLLERGWLAEPDHQALFAAFLIEQSETAVNKVLRTLLGLELEPKAREPLAGMLVICLEIIPIARLSSMCLIDRALKHNFTEHRVAHHQKNVTELLAAIAAGELDTVTVDRLAQVSSHDLERLREAADAHGHRDTLDARHEALAVQAVEVIASAPKAVSQSNAEQLLARRVYTDPGHFLIELLQNAEDAGADTWRVVFDADKVIVWHNGSAFDTRDVVGVTSIGQTTKTKSQIGFFGVGFKSIYEITDRPRVFSDVYQFEIADISVPKVLGQRPAHLPAEGTVLVLPLRNPADPVRSPRALFDKARGLDPCVLFTLRGIDAIELELTAEAEGGPQHHIMREGEPDAMSRSTLSIDPPGEIQHFVVRDDEYRYTQGKRTAGRADTTRVMVGVRVDEDGRPIPLSDSARTVYSYLPTDERSGLRFFVQGHFDVPVDRERITPDSDWNRWILEKVPGQLAKVAQALSGHKPEAVRGLLDVLPLEPEMHAPGFRAMVSKLPAALRDIALLPGHDGTLHAPREIVIAAPEIVALFEGQPIPGERLSRKFLRTAERFYFLDPELPQRSRDVARALGCPVFELAHLVDLLKVPRDAPSEHPVAALRHPDPARIQELFIVCLDGLEALERERNRIQVLSLVGKLKSLPIVLTQDGQLTHPRNVRRASSGLRQVYTGLGDFVHPELDALLRDTPVGESEEDASEEAAALDRCTAFLNRLGVPVLEGHQLLTELEKSLEGRRVLASLDETPLPGSAERLEALFTYLVEDAPFELKKRAGRLPLFAAVDQRFYPVALRPDDRAGVLAAGDTELEQALVAFYDHRRPIARLADASPGARLLLERLGAPLLSFDVLVDDLEAGVVTLELEGLTLLHALLEHFQEHLPERDCKRLAVLPIWPDTRGQARPLLGEGRTLMPASPEVERFFPEAPFIHEAVRERAHLRDMGIEVIAAAAVVEALGDSAQPPLAIPRTPTTLARVHDFLLAHGDRLGAASRRLLAELPVLLSDRGEIRGVHELCRAQAPLRGLYGDYPGRHFVDPKSASFAVIETFSLTEHLTQAGPETLIDDLASHAPELLGENILQPDSSLPILNNAKGLRDILHHLSGEIGSLTRATVEKLAALPLFPHPTGILGALGASLEETEGRVFAVHEAFRGVFDAAGIALLHDGVQRLIAPLLEALARRPLGLEALLARLATLETVDAAGEPRGMQGARVLAEVHALLVENKARLVRSAQAVDVELDALPIWPTVGGAVVSASGALVSAGLEAVIAEGTPEHERLLSVLVTPAATDVFNALSVYFDARDVSEVVWDLVEALSKPGEPLGVQPRFLASLDALRQVIELLAQEKHEGQLPLAAADSTLQTGELWGADATTAALVAGLPVSARLLHPELWDAVEAGFKDACERVEPQVILQALNAGDALGSAERRAQFYAWLQSHEREIFTVDAAREILREAPLFPTEQGSMLSASDLVMDEELPDLGIDWRPSSEIPRATLQLLQGHLKVGQLELTELLGRHLMPAYARFLDEQRLEEAARLLAYVAKHTRSWGDDRLLALIDEDFRVEYGEGQLAVPSSLIWPEGELEAAMEAVWGRSLPRPSTVRYGDEMRGFLRSIGVRSMPTPSELEGALRRPVTTLEHALGVARLVSEMVREDASCLEQLPGLRARPWVMSGDGVVRRPSELFWSEAKDVMMLVGDFPELYAEPEIELMLRDKLGRALGFKQREHVSIENVMRRIDASANAGSMVEVRVYLWIEEALAAGRTDAAQLQALIADKAWICTDDHSFFNHTKVLGVNAVSIFGQMRGYWLAAERCPLLSRTLGIPTRVTAESIIELLAEIGDAVVEQGDVALLRQEPGLPVRLRACYAELAKLNAGLPAASWPVILCEERHRPEGAGESVERLRILGADAPTLFRSDTPTLLSLFESVCPIHVAVRGRGDERDALDRFYKQMKLRRIRDAYRVVPDMSSVQDRTQAYGDAIQSMRGLLRALLSVMPRIQKEKGGLPNVWLYERRLAPLAASGSIKVVESLTVRYVLQGVGEIRRQTAAVYDQQGKLLLLDVELVKHPESDPTDLALGLIDTIYDGADVQSFFSIIALLLQKRTSTAMNAYLDRLHYPEGHEELGPHLILAERIGQIFDLGVYRKLTRRFPVLRGRESEPWRDPERLERLELKSTQTRRQWARKAVPMLLEVIGIVEPPEGLEEAFMTLLSAASLDDIDPSLYATTEDPTRHERVETPVPLDRELHAQGAAAPSDFRRSEPGRAPEARSTEEIRSQLADLRQNLRSERTPAAGSEAAKALGELLRLASAPEARAAVDTMEKTSPDFDWDAVTSEELPVDFATPNRDEAVPPGVWQRLKHWFGGKKPEARPLPSMPDWANPSNNSFRPQGKIGPQLWATPERLEAMSKHEPTTSLHFEPESLPTPYLYAIQTVGARFDAEAQTWLPAGAPPESFYAPPERSGHVVVFEGLMVPGLAQLPVPMHGQLAAAPQVVEGEAQIRLRRNDDGTVWAHIQAAGPVRIRYGVQLSKVPLLTGPELGALEISAELMRPTVSARTFPRALRRWLDAEREASRSLWERAMLVQGFVQKHYVYDAGFMERPEVQASVERRQPGVGNHHLEALHASGQGAVLGRGICYELNTLVVELLRHLGVPSLVGTGWVLDRGVVHRPDHLFALAIVPSSRGPVLLPLDAATGVQGPIRPMAHAGRRQQERLPHTLAPIPEVEGPWSAAKIFNVPGDDDLERQLTVLRAREMEGLRDEARGLRDIILHVLTMRSEEPSEGLAALLTEPPGHAIEQVENLRAAAIEVLGRGELVGMLLGVIRGDFEDVAVLPQEIRELAALQLVQVETHSRFQVGLAEL